MYDCKLINNNNGCGRNLRCLNRCIAKSSYSPVLCFMSILITSSITAKNFNSISQYFKDNCDDVHKISYLHQLYYNKDQLMSPVSPESAANDPKPYTYIFNRSPLISISEVQ